MRNFSTPYRSGFYRRPQPGIPVDLAGPPAFPPLPLLGEGPLSALLPFREGPVSFTPNNFQSTSVHSRFIAIFCAFLMLRRDPTPNFTERSMSFYCTEICSLGTDATSCEARSPVQLRSSNLSRPPRIARGSSRATAVYGRALRHGWGRRPERTRPSASRIAPEPPPYRNSLPGRGGRPISLSKLCLHRAPT